MRDDAPPTLSVLQDREDWERQYQTGQWNSLTSLSEFAHYTLVAAYVQSAKRPVKVLDVGCGEGVLLRYLDLNLIRQYTGIDIAQSALDHITPRREQDRLICTSIENYQPDDQWDVILFNEVLYYTRQPVALFRRFEKHLNPGGLLVSSIYRKPNPFAYNNRCLRQIRRYIAESGHELIDQVEVCQLSRGTVWQIIAVRPRVIERVSTLSSDVHADEFNT